MKEILRFTIPINPTTKKNSQDIVPIKDKNGTIIRHVIVQGKKYKAYERDALKLLPKCSTIDIACNVKCLFYRKTFHRVDLPNLLNAIDDIMVKGGVLEDDNCNIIVSHDGSRVYHDKENPRTEVIIERYEDG